MKRINRILTLTRQGDSIYYSGPYIDEPQWGGNTVAEALALAHSRGLYDPNSGDSVNDLTAMNPHNLAPDTFTPPTHAERRARAHKYHDIVFISISPVSRSMAYEWELAGPNGARFVLLPDGNHSKADVQKAKQVLTRNRDVVGKIKVEWPPKKKK